MLEFLNALASQPHQIIAVSVTLVVFVLLQNRRNVPVDLLFLSGLVLVTVSGVITPQQAFSGFANSAVLTIGALLGVSTALRNCGVLDWIGSRLLGTAKTEKAGMIRLILALVPSSAFILNTPLVAMMAPVVVDWCRKRDISPSRVLIPVSYLAILGGVCTLIGTSTTLVVNAQLASEHQRYTIAFPNDSKRSHPKPDSVQANESEGDGVISSLSVMKTVKDRQGFIDDVKPLSLFEMTRVGVPCAIAGSVVLFLLGPRLLPDRSDLVEQLGDQRREYMVEMLVQPECKLIGRTVEDAGLRQLPGLFLIEIDRDGRIIGPVSPEEVISADDRLIFTGVVETIVDLEKIPGLVPAVDVAYEFHPQKKQQRHLTEVVLSRSSPLIRSTIKEANFRELYGAAVVAVHRDGRRMKRKLGDVMLRAGDTLLLQTRTEFSTLYRNSGDFYLVSAVADSESRQHHKFALAALIVCLMLVWMIVASFTPANEVGWKSTAVIAFIALAALIATKCLPIADARNSIDIQLLVTIASALGLGMALSQSGAAGSIAIAITSLVTSLGGNKIALLVTVYVLTAVMTEMISNTAVAAIMLPIVINIAAINDANPRTFIIAISLAASLAFITPIGYQTNLMVMGPGNYKPSDFARCGFPVSITVAVTALILLPVFWPL